MEWIKRHTNSKRSWMWKRGKKVRWKEGHKENKKLRKCQWKTSIRQKNNDMNGKKQMFGFVSDFFVWHFGVEKDKKSSNKSFCLRINKCTCYSKYSEYHRLWQRIFNQMPLHVSASPLQSEAVRVRVCIYMFIKTDFSLNFLHCILIQFKRHQLKNVSEDIQIRILFTKTNKSKIIARFVFHAHESTLYWKTNCM